MPRTLPPAAHPDDVEQRFYEALQRGDLAAMMSCWTDEDDAVCVHPGGARLVGLAAVREAFAAMFTQGGVPIRAEVVHRLQQPGVAVHSVVETVRVATDDGGLEAVVWATNVYAQTPQGWRMVLHHASPAPAAAQPAEPVISKTLH